MDNYQEEIKRNRLALAETEKALVDALGPPEDDLEEYYHTIDLPNGSSSKCKVFRSSTTPPAKRPLIVLFHGGGFGAGSPEMCTRPAREFARAFGAVVVSASYRLAPEHQFPTPVTSGLDVVTWVDEHAESTLGVCLASGFVLGGLSAGCTIASVACQQLKLQHPVTGCFLAMALLMTPETVPEKHKHMWTPRQDNAKYDPYMMEYLQRNPKTIGMDPYSPYASPLNHPGGLKNLPRTWLQVGERDPLRDDGIIYAQMLREVGVEARIHVEAGAMHECFSIWWNAETGSQGLKEETMAGMAWLLRRDQ